MIDCVEFSERLRYGDVASEIAFLAMDLDRLGAPGSPTSWSRPTPRSAGDEDLAVFVPFYKCYRACVRGKVESLRSLEREVGAAERERARQLASSYFALASRYARCSISGSDRRMRAFGLGQIDRRAHASASQGLQSDQLGPRSQAPRVRSPRMSTSAPTIGANIYSDQVYENHLRHDAGRSGAACLDDGCGAILDATFKESADRQLALALATRHGVPVLFVECVVSEEEAIRRLERRGSAQSEVSDATPEVHRRQRAEFEPISEIPPRNHLRIDTTREREHLVAEIEDALEHLASVVRYWASNESVSSSGIDRTRRRGRFLHPAVDLAALVVQGALLSRRQAERVHQAPQLRHRRG